MALSKIQSESINLADTFAFTGTVTGAGESTVESSKITLDSASHSATGIPDGVREVHLLWSGVSTSAGNPGMHIQVGTSSGLVTSGYNSQYAYIYDSNTMARAASSAGLEIGNWGAGIVMHGFASCFRTNGTDDLWIYHYFTTLYTDYAGQLFGTGMIDLSAPLDRIAMVCVTTGTFDAGTMQVLYR